MQLPGVLESLEFEASEVDGEAGQSACGEGLSGNASSKSCLGGGMRGSGSVGFASSGGRLAESLPTSSAMKDEGAAAALMHELKLYSSADASSPSPSRQTPSPDRLAASSPVPFQRSERRPTTLPAGRVTSRSVLAALAASSGGDEGRVFGDHFYFQQQYAAADGLGGPTTTSVLSSDALFHQQRSLQTTPSTAAPAPSSADEEKTASSFGDEWLAALQQAAAASASPAGPSPPLSPTTAMADRFSPLPLPTTSPSRSSVAVESSSSGGGSQTQGGGTAASAQRCVRFDVAAVAAAAGVWAEAELRRLAVGRQGGVCPPPPQLLASAGMNSTGNADLALGGEGIRAGVLPGADAAAMAAAYASAAFKRSSRRSNTLPGTLAEIDLTNTTGKTEKAEANANALFFGVGCWSFGETQRAATALCVWLYSRGIEKRPSPSALLQALRLPLQQAQTLPE